MEFSGACAKKNLLRIVLHTVQFFVEFDLMPHIKYRVLFQPYSATKA